MSQELHYTSVPRGLKPGSRGFGTVAATANLPDSLADRLEALSGYQAVYPPGDPSEALNPVAFVHVRLTVGGYVQEVLSRIGPAGLDYSGRPNKYAHHVILEPGERPDAGPAWLLGQPGFISAAWAGEPRILAEGPPVPRGDRPPGVAEAWQSLTGDAGWAGVLAEAFLADPRRPVFLVFRPGVELLPLFVEAIALLPASRRWDVEFSTYLTTLPPGISCSWRGVLEGSPEAKRARRLPNALIVDLCRPLGRAQGGGLVHLARTGQPIEIPEAAVPASAEARRESGPTPVVTAGPPPRLPTAVGPRPRTVAAGRDWVPDLATDGSLLAGSSLRSRRRPLGRVAAIVAAAVLVPIVASVSLSSAVRQRLGLESAPGPIAAGHPAHPVDVPKVAPAHAEAPPDEIPLSEADAIPDPATIPVAEADLRPAAEAPAADAPRPSPPAEKARREPMILAFATPDVPRSGLGGPARQDRAIPLPEDADERIEILNGLGFRLAAVPGASRAWDVATRTGSGIGGGFVLARLIQADARTWRFQWTEKAKTQATQVEGFKDAILGLHGRGGRPIYVLLRGVERVSERPLVVWKDQRILYDKPEPRVRSVEWAGVPDPLEGSRWKPRILRWRVVVTRPETAAGAGDRPRRVFEPRPDPDGKATAAEPALECDLVPGEVKLRLAIDPARPGLIEVRIETDLDGLLLGRDNRDTRLDELRKATPRAKDGSDRDPLEYRRGRLARLRENEAKNGPEIKDLEKQVADLERIREIRETVDLLTKNARVELSVVIGLDVDGPGILEIARVGEFGRK